MGLDVPSGCPGVVWVCFWAPGPPPHGFSVARFDAHAWWPVLGGWSDRGAWWFENWIVDASKGNFGFFLLIAISPNSSIEFGFEIDRFVIILVLRFVVWRSCYQETRGWGNDNLFCCCAACEGVWWMPWQTVPMKDV